MIASKGMSSRIHCLELGSLPKFPSPPNNLSNYELVRSEPSGSVNSRKLHPVHYCPAAGPASTASESIVGSNSTRERVSHAVRGLRRAGVSGTKGAKECALRFLTVQVSVNRAVS